MRQIVDSLRKCLDFRQRFRDLHGGDLPWIQVAPGAPYFKTEGGESWTPIGQNDAITWPELAGLFRRRDLAAVDRHLAHLAAHGVTCLRLMLEYVQGEHRHLEKPAGAFWPAMVRLWDDLFALCARHGLRVLLTPFDDEYFRHIQWAHLASGGAGGGMRWPNRHPHMLALGMRAARKALAGFTPLLDWTRFRRKNLDEETEISHPGCTAFACGDAGQAVAWVLRTDRLDRSGRVRRDAEPVSPELRLPGLAPGRYRVTFWDTAEGRCAGCAEVDRSEDGKLRLLLPPLVTDGAVAVRRRP